MTTKKQYAIPVYNVGYLDSIPDSDINCTITDNTFLETLLLKLRGESIKFASKLKKESQTKEVLLTTEIEQLEKNESTQNPKPRLIFQQKTDDYYLLYINVRKNDNIDLHMSVCHLKTGLT